MSESESNAASPAIAIIGMAGRFPGADDVERVLGEPRRRRRVDHLLHRGGAAGRRRPAGLLADPAYVRARALIAGPRAVRRRALRLQPARGRAHGPAAPAPPRVRLGGARARRLRPAAATRARSASSPAPASNTYLLCEPARQRRAARRGGRLPGDAGERRRLPGHPRLLQARPARARASPCRPPARPRWSRSTSPSRACSTASATWRWPAACGSRCRSGRAISTSPAGSSRPTATAARSTPRRRARLDGDGVGVVVLKRLADALADGDHVHAVIRGSAINNDGAAEGRLHGAERRRPGRGDRHGPGRGRRSTPRRSATSRRTARRRRSGDPIEVAALRRVFAARPGGGASAPSARSRGTSAISTPRRGSPG